MKRFALMMLCVYPLKVFVVEDLIDIHHIVYASVCAKDVLDADQRATHMTVWTEKEWEETKDFPGYKPVDEIKGWGEPK